MSGMEIQLHAFLTSELDRGEWSAACPNHLSNSLVTILSEISRLLRATKAL